MEINSQCQKIPPMLIAFYEYNLVFLKYPKYYNSSTLSFHSQIFNFKCLEFEVIGHMRKELIILTGICQ